MTYRELTKDEINKLWETVRPRIDPKTGKQKIDPHTGSPLWKGVSDAMRDFKVSRQTIYNWMERYWEYRFKPIERARAEIKEAREEVIAVEEFDRTKFVTEDLPKWSDYWRLSPQTGRMELSDTGQKIKRTAKQGWSFLNKKDPHFWQAEDFEKLWNNPVTDHWIDERTGKINFNRASDLLMIMRIIRRFDIWGEYDARKPTKGLKPKPEKTMWFFTDEEIPRMVKAIEEPDTLLFFTLGIVGGARSDALLKIRVEDIFYAPVNVIQVYESKVKEIVQKTTADSVLELLKRYIRDFDIKAKLFPSEYNTYRIRLKVAAQRAKIVKTHEIATHILKHTFVTQASMHGVSLDTVSSITGTDPQTLLKFYFGASIQKQRAEILDEELPLKKWKYYVKEDIMPTILARYEEIKGKPKIDGWRTVR